MLFRQVLNDDLACASYVVSCGGEAVVVDPRWDIDEYLRLAEYHGFRIAHVVETHVHADHVSGRGRLAAATGATIHLPAGSRRLGPAPRAAARRHHPGGPDGADRALHPGAPARAHEPGRDRPRPVAAPRGGPDRATPCWWATSPGRTWPSRPRRAPATCSPPCGSSRPSATTSRCGRPTSAARSAAAEPSADAPSPRWARSDCANRAFGLADEDAFVTVPDRDAAAATRQRRARGVAQPPPGRTLRRAAGALDPARPAPGGRGRRARGRPARRRLRHRARARGDLPPRRPPGRGHAGGVGAGVAAPDRHHGPRRGRGAPPGPPAAGGRDGRRPRRAGRTASPAGAAPA